MRARWLGPLLLGLLLALPSSVAVAGEPKPTPVDIKPFRDQLVVLQDTLGGTYVVLPGLEPRIWFGTGKTLYEQIRETTSSTADTGAWMVGTVAPTLAQAQQGTVQRKDDGSYHKWCGDAHDVPLTAVTADKAKLLLDKLSLASTALIRWPHLFARDDAGVYYYVDMIRKQYGGNGYRVFVGKKGAMKQVPLEDIASDTAGEVFATKTGDLRLVRVTNGETTGALWVRGEKKTSLMVLDLTMSSPVIYKDLGIYTFIGSLCDDF